MGYSDEELDLFIKSNRELIERMTELQKDTAVSIAGVSKDLTHQAAKAALDTKDLAKSVTEQTYNMFMDKEVQKHFVAMGLEFIACVAAMMSKAPLPDFIKESAADAQSNLKSTACGMNDQCAAKNMRQKVEVTVAEPENDGRIDVADAE
jgi:hypothetical protein